MQIIHKKKGFLVIKKKKNEKEKNITINVIFVNWQNNINNINNIII